MQKFKDAGGVVPPRKAKGVAKGKSKTLAKTLSKVFFFS